MARSRRMSVAQRLTSYSGPRPPVMALHVLGLPVLRVLVKQHWGRAQQQALALSACQPSSGYSPCTHDPSGHGGASHGGRLAVWTRRTLQFLTESSENRRLP